MIFKDKIDIVLPWVDPSDKTWQADKIRYSPVKHPQTSNDEKYFRDWDILKYLFRSIEYNMPWVHNIHFITYGHIPTWMNIEHPKLKIHPHASFFKKHHAFPVFSSDAIEMNIGNIPGLADKFIYFNDDEIVVKPVDTSRFFRGNLPVDFLVQNLPRGGWLYRLLRTKDVYPDICKNCISPLNGLVKKYDLYRKNKNIFYDTSYSLKDKILNFIFNIFKDYLWITPNHSPQPLLKSSIIACEELSPELIIETANSRFRSAKDICHYIFRNYNLVTGQFYPHNYHDSHCIVLSDYNKSVKELNMLNEYTFVCTNESEFLSHQDFVRLKPILEKKL